MLQVLVLLSSLITQPGEQPKFDQQGRLQVGDILPYEILSPQFTTARRSANPELMWSEEIHLPGATYVAAYFSRFHLPAGDYLVVRSPDGERSWRYEGMGKADLGITDGFWSIHITGERLLLDLYSRGESEGYGVEIGQVARGFLNPAPEAICGTDDKENAICYENSDPEIYQESRAVARLLINGNSLCTGWLLGSEGHLMTNNHCITTASEALNTDYEFLAEGPTCGTFCGQLQCDGVIEATMGTLIQTDAALDYTLVELPVNLTSTYGFFQMRATGPVLEERIYIPQHPGGRGKEFAVFSTHPNNPSGFGEVDSAPSASRIIYFADTEGGSSGSPVVGHGDNCVVAIHHATFGCTAAGGSGNTGLTSDDIIADLGANVPADSVVAVGNCSVGVGTIFVDGFESGDTSSWSSSTP